MTVTSNAVIDAIYKRRSIGKVSDVAPPKEVIEQVIDAAIQAPNHHLTQPWRFFVLTGNARNELGQAMVRARLATEPDPDSVPEKVLEKISQKPLRAPVIIVLAVQPQPGPKIVEIEEVCSGAAAGQNLLLAADSLGLAAMWRTGDPCFSDEVKEFLGLGNQDHVLGFIYLGYPTVELPPREREPASSVTTWMGED